MVVMILLTLVSAETATVRPKTPGTVLNSKTYVEQNIT
jgi:hypothetical protein